MPKEKTLQWFENWFDSPYYHVLYKNRSFNEAELFIDNLINYLQINSDSKFLDAGCGKGRHSIYLNKKGYNVVGIDLSQASITCASQSNNERLQFFVEDMRKTDRINQFDYVLNLFTSFGYFENERDNFSTINCLGKALKPKGIFILDFMNAQKEIANLILHEKKIIEGIEFKISRSIENNFIVKQINFSDKGQEYNFQERVKALHLDDFRKYFDDNKLKILHLLGNYNLDEFNPVSSNRLIIIAQKEY